MSKGHSVLLFHMRVVERKVEMVLLPCGDGVKLNHVHKETKNERERVRDGERDLFQLQWIFEDLG